jgi:sterol desaturase/sphingolipid hydroxylase (fatty acid hydroxylase superfamily)
MEESFVSGAAAPARYGREVKTLAHAWREFRHKRSPWVIGSAIAAMAVARALVGGFGWRDAVAAAAMVAIYPFGEWAIHVYLLHARPFEVRGRRIDLASARAHREHHEAPNDLGLILLAPLEAVALLGLAVPLIPALAAAVFALAPGPVPLGPLVTAVLSGYVLVGVYEWTHFLIHTAYRPRSRYYRTIWRTHRLHHFKNEHYWHGITNTVGDRAFGTFPDQRTIPRSGTARTLDWGA